jgi:hypothetical protein
MHNNFSAPEAVEGKIYEDSFLLVRGTCSRYGARMDMNGEQPGETRGVEPKVAHPERYCPNCSAELKENRCKLSCEQCGFYLSCSDFY